MINFVLQRIRSRWEGRQIATELIDVDKDPDSILVDINEIAYLIRGRREQIIS
jgi:hypothetical protein